MTIQYRLYNLRTGYPVAELLDAFDEKALVERNGDGGGSFQIPRDSPDVAILTDNDLKDDLFAVAFIDGVARSGFFPQKQEDPKKASGPITFSGPGPKDIFNYMYFSDPVIATPKQATASWTDDAGLVMDAMYAYPEMTKTYNQGGWPYGLPAKWPNNSRYYPDSISSGSVATPGRYEQHCWLIQPKGGTPAEQTQWETGSQKFYIASRTKFKVFAVDATPGPSPVFGMLRKQLISVTQYPSISDMFEFTLDKKSYREQPTALMVVTYSDDLTTPHQFLITQISEYEPNKWTTASMSSYVSTIVPGLVPPFGSPPNAFPGIAGPTAFWRMLNYGFLSTLPAAGSRGSLDRFDFSDISAITNVQRDSRGGWANPTVYEIDQGKSAYDFLDTLLEASGGRIEWTYEFAADGKLTIKFWYFASTVGSEISLQAPMGFNYGLSTFGGTYDGVKVGRWVEISDYRIRQIPYPEPSTFNWRTRRLKMSRESIAAKTAAIDAENKWIEMRMPRLSVSIDSTYIKPFVDFKVGDVLPVKDVRYTSGRVKMDVASIAVSSGPIDKYEIELGLFTSDPELMALKNERN